MTVSINLIGQRFDKLVVIERLEATPSGTRWLCRCDCGNTIPKVTTQLRRRTRKFGGCRSCETLSRAAVHIRHGDCPGRGKAHLYRIWKGIKDRCRNPGSTSWVYYGAKGIRVCDEWDAYEAFRDWAFANGYQDGLSIDRLDSDGNYEPSNCEWVTPAENSRRVIHARPSVAV